MVPMTDKTNKCAYLTGRQPVALGYPSVTLQNSVKLAQISPSKTELVWPADFARILLLQCQGIPLPLFFIRDRIFQERFSHCRIIWQADWSGIRTAAATSVCTKDLTSLYTSFSLIKIHTEESIIPLPQFLNSLMPPAAASWSNQVLCWLQGNGSFFILWVIPLGLINKSIYVLFSHDGLKETM